MPIAATAWHRARWTAGVIPSIFGDVADTLSGIGGASLLEQAFGLTC